MKTIKLATAGVAAFLGLSAAAFAGSISGVKVEPASGTVGQQVKVTVDGTNEGVCGLRVEYGNGDVDVTKMSEGKDNFPRSFMKSYNKAGTYTVIAKGGKDGSTFGCPGETKTTVTIAEAPKPVAAAAPAAVAKPAAAAAPTCPDGYKLNAKSVDKKSGAYSCAGAKGVKMLDKPLECSEKTEFFSNTSSKGTTLGCVKTAPAKK
jgi:hypothetical protein